MKTKEYLKGFNSGYLLRKHRPMLMKDLEVGLQANTPYTMGLKDGNKEYEKELDLKLERLQDRSRNKERGSNLGLEL